MSFWQREAVFDRYVVYVITIVAGRRLECSIVRIKQNTKKWK